jgi:hypothetical protein
MWPPTATDGRPKRGSRQAAAYASLVLAELPAQLPLVQELFCARISCLLCK